MISLHRTDISFNISRSGGFLFLCLPTPQYVVLEGFVSNRALLESNLINNKLRTYGYAVDPVICTGL